MRWLSKLVDRYERMRPAKRALVGQILTLILIATGAPAGVAYLAGSAAAMGATLPPVVVPVPQAPADPVPEILQGIVPEARP